MQEITSEGRDNPTLVALLNGCVGWMANRMWA